MSTVRFEYQNKETLDLPIDESLEFPEGKVVNYRYYDNGMVRFSRIGQKVRVFTRRPSLYHPEDGFCYREINEDGTLKSDIGPGWDEGSEFCLCNNEQGDRLFYALDDTLCVVDDLESLKQDFNEKFQINTKARR